MMGEEHFCGVCFDPCDCTTPTCTHCPPEEHAEILSYIDDDPERDFDWNDYDDVGTHREG